MKNKQTNKESTLFSEVKEDQSKESTLFSEVKEDQSKELIENNIGTVVNCSRLCIRNKPNKINSIIINTVPVGTKIIVEKKKCINDFYYVCVDGDYGYCSKKYIKLD